jgi:hypothetical protein
MTWLLHNKRLLLVALALAVVATLFGLRQIELTISDHHHRLLAAEVTFARAQDAVDAVFGEAQDVIAGSPDPVTGYQRSDMLRANSAHWAGALSGALADARSDRAARQMQTLNLDVRDALTRMLRGERLRACVITAIAVIPDDRGGRPARGGDRARDQHADSVRRGHEPIPRQRVRGAHCRSRCVLRAPRGGARRNDHSGARRARRCAGSDERGSIHIRTDAGDDDVIITVTDTGGGIPPDIAERIFDPFFTTKEVGRGTGQGLTLSRTIVVERHGGSLTFDSRPGDGTTFFVRLPVRAAVTPDRETAPA